MGTSLSGERVTWVLDRAIEQHDKPTGLVMDNGPEFAVQALDAWAYRREAHNRARPHSALGNVPSEEYAALQELPDRTAGSVSTITTMRI